MKEAATTTPGIGSFDLFALAFGTIVGVGWIIVMGHWLTSAGPGGVLLALGAGALMIACIAFCYAAVGAVVTGEGGELAYVQSQFGRTTGVMTGWLLVFVFSAVAAFEAVSVGWLATVIWPALRLEGLWPWGSDSAAGGDIITLASIIIVAVANSRDIRTTAAVQRALIIALLVCTTVFLLAAVVAGDVENWRPWFSASNQPARWSGTLTVLAAAPFWYAGFNVIPQAMSARSRTVTAKHGALLMIVSVLIAAVFYFAVTLACAAMLPRDEIQNAALPAAAAFETALGSPLLAKVVLVAGLLGLVTTWNAVVFAGARVVATMAVDGSLPAQWFRLSHGATALQKRAVLAISIVSLVLCLGGREGLMPIVSVVGLGFAILYLLTCLTHLRMTHRDKMLPPLGSKVIMKVVGLAGVAFSALLVVLGGREAIGGLRHGSAMHWIVMALWVVVGLALCMRASGRSAAVRATNSSVLRDERPGG